MDIYVLYTTLLCSLFIENCCIESAVSTVFIIGDCFVIMVLQYCTLLALYVHVCYMHVTYTTCNVCLAVLQAVVGVAGGATRAALVQHQARRDNMADVSAKDGSQVNCLKVQQPCWTSLSFLYRKL